MAIIGGAGIAWWRSWLLLLFFHFLSLSCTVSFRTLDTLGARSATTSPVNGNINSPINNIFSFIQFINVYLVYIAVILGTNLFIPLILGILVNNGSAAGFTQTDSWTWSIYRVRIVCKNAIWEGLRQDIPLPVIHFYEGCWTKRNSWQPQRWMPFDENLYHYCLLYIPLWKL